MANIVFLKRSKLFFAAIIVSLSFLSLFMSAPSANAAGENCNRDRRSCNSDEDRAWLRCKNDEPSIAQGAIWFNNSSSAPTNDGYYALGVKIGANDTNATVYIRGSVYSCGQFTSPGSSVYAVNVRTDNDDGRLPDSRLLTIQGPTVLDRGQYNGAPSQWTSMGSSVTASLDVSGLAPSTGSTGGDQTIYVGIYRCYSSNGISKTGECNTAKVPVRVLRAPQPPYKLTPTVTVNPSSGIETGQPVVASPTVSSDGAGSATGIGWQLTRFVVPRNAGVPGGSINGTAPRDYFGNRPSTTTEASGNRDFPSGITNLDSSSKVTEDLEVGSRVCYALSLQPYTNADSSNLWRHSDPQCVAVSKKPKVQVLGGDLLVGRGTYNNSAAVSNVSTSTSYSTNTSAYYGSWSEYAIIPSGTVKGMASGAMYSGGSTGGDLCQLSVLTISNRSGAGSSCNADSVGKYVSSAIAPNIASRFPVPGADKPRQIVSDSINLNTVAPSLVYTTPARQANLSVISPQAIGAGRWVVINAPDTTVTISDNIRYTDAALSRAEDIPQVVIIAKNIIIADNVTNIDAWLIASGAATATDRTAGYINTCGSVPIGSPSSATLNSTTCSGKLTINGPVQANKLYMYRTAGAGTNENMGDSAEVFNLRGDAYLWASSYNPGSGRLPTVSSKELPPRF
jgi:hypothetical protein